MVIQPGPVQHKDNFNGRTLDYDRPVHGMLKKKSMARGSSKEHGQSGQPDDIQTPLKSY